MKIIQTDIAVFGAGPAGIAAALMARHHGARVLLVEKSGTLGGMSTAGMLNIWCGDSSSHLLSRLRTFSGDDRIFDPMALRSYYFELLEEAGVDILTETVPIDVTSNDEQITSVTLFSCGVKALLKAGVAIDATGDGDVAFMAGVPFCLGRESDHRMMPMSLEFLLGGVNDARAVYPNTFSLQDKLYEELLAPYVESGRVPYPAGHVILIKGQHPGTAAVNMTNSTDYDPTDPVARSKAASLTHRQIAGIVAYLRACVPGYEACYVSAIGHHAGVRESRHFEGVARLTEEDILAERVFDDWVVSRAAYTFGIHALTGRASDHDPSIPAYHGEQYTIPYGVLLPKTLRNLLFAGRCVSATHMAHASMRVMPIAMALGEGAGLGAAIAVKKDCAPHQVDARDIQVILRDVYHVPSPMPKCR